MTSSLSVYSRLASVKKQSERASLRSSLGTLIYLGTFSLLEVTHLDTWLASSCTRAFIWSILDLGATSDSSLAKLLMHDTTQCIVALERDLFWMASSSAFVHTFPVVSPAAFMICTTCFTVYAQVSYPPTSSSGQLGNDHLPSSSAMSSLSAISNHEVAWVRIWRLHLKPSDRRFWCVGDRSTPT